MEEHPRARGEARSSAEPVFLSAAHLLRLARAFSCVFWGIPLALLLFFNALRVRLPSLLPLPTYVIGILLVYVGAILMYTVGRLTPRWLETVRRLLGVLFLEVYFAPFVHWWQRQPTTTYFTVNLLALILCGLLVLLLADRLAEQLACVVRDAVFQFEAAVSGWAVLLLLVLPFLGVSAYGVAAALRHDMDLYSLLVHLAREVPRVALFSLLLPFTMTLACLWKAKELCLRLLKTSHPSAAEPLENRRDMVAGPR